MHEGHRERLRNKFTANEDALENHELLELLLFYALPRKNTNEIAHKLIDAFGSIRGVFDADLYSLSQIEGVGTACATLIKTVSQINMRYRLQDDVRQKLDSYSAMSDYLKKLYIGKSNEIAYMLILSNSCRLLGIEKLCDGAVNSAEITTYKISKLCSRINAANIVLVHNHPDGSPEPSKEDVYATQILAKFCTQIKVNLIDHFIVAGDFCTPILNGDLTDLQKEIPC